MGLSVELKQKLLSFNHFKCEKKKSLTWKRKSEIEKEKKKFSGLSINIKTPATGVRLD